MPETFSFYLASGTEKIISSIYDCTERTQIGLAARTPDINTADISFRLTAPQSEGFRAYQVGSIEILLATTNPSFNKESLDADQIRNLFIGKSRNWVDLGGNDAEIRLWVYGEGNELQDAFNETMRTTNRISSNARQAQHPGAMRDALLTDSSAIGILPRETAGDDFYIPATIGTFPLLAHVPTTQNDRFKALIFCLQSN